MRDPDRSSRGAEGLALLDKPPGISSFEALAAVKRALGTRRVGHTGTLDRFAGGLIAALAGRLTRLAPLLSGQDKRYEARVRFGEETDTLDPEGVAVASAPVPARGELESALRRFVGEIEQVPPAYSAVHHEGERAYRLARRGEQPALRPRLVRVHSLELAAWDPPFADLVVSCGAGTYVRSLARDLALACGSRATVVALVRTAVGPFSLAEAAPCREFDPSRLLPPRSFLPRLQGIACLEVGPAAADRVAVGALPRDEDLRSWPEQAPRAALLGPDGSLLAVLDRGPGGAPRLAAVFAASGGAPGAGGPGRSGSIDSG